jgi:hypothetical protein
MRRSSVATALVVLTAGLTAASALRRLADRRRRVTVPVVAAAPAPAVATAPVEPVLEYDAVVLPFPPRVVVAPVAQQPAAPVRCGDSGGRTKAGAPCGARATAGGRCHHHRLAA